MKKLMIVFALAILIATVSGVAQAGTVEFTAADVKAVMAGYGAPLHDASNQWGLWAVRAMPIVNGNGIYTITSGSTSQTGWGTSAPSWYSWAGYGTNCAWFWDASGAEAAGTAANPLYMIMDVPQDNWWSSAFDKNGSWVGDYSPGGGGTFYASGYDGGAGGTNLITAVDDNATFSFDFTLDSGATWDGAWQFLVDGSKYTLGTYESPGAWVENFFGGYGSYGGLSGNTGAGYVVPEPTTMLLLTFGLFGLAVSRKRFIA